jgi:hypothetical protein
VPSDLIRFPDLAHYRDTGEGGVFVLLAVPEPSGYSHGCHVDVSINLSAPDACLNSDLRNAVWQPFDYHKSGYKKAFQAKDALDAAGQPELGAWALQTTSPDDWSANLLAAVHLGSSPHSLWSEQQGAYWTATVDDLTDAGLALHDGLRAAFGVEPVLITCLDT